MSTIDRDSEITLLYAQAVQEVSSISSALLASVVQHGRGGFIQEVMTSSVTRDQITFLDFLQDELVAALSTDGLAMFLPILREFEAKVMALTPPKREGRL